MKPVLRFQGIFRMMLCVVLLVSAVVFSSVNPTRVDFFDNSGNHLMFIVFNYNATGALTGRTVYMADSTFKREVYLTKDPTTGARQQETSVDFNQDTSFITRYQFNGTASSFTIHDQFKLDHIGGAVNVAAVDPLNFNLTYTDGTFASRMQYGNDASGNLSKVIVYDAASVMQYYGTFSSTGVKPSALHSINGAPQAVIKSRGSAGVDIRLNLSAAGVVKCELMTLSGRVAGTLLNEALPKGHFLRSVATVNKAKVSSGVYLIVVSVNGKVVSSSRYLADIAAVGGVK